MVGRPGMIYREAFGQQKETCTQDNTIAEIKTLRPNIISKKDVMEKDGWFQLKRIWCNMASDGSSCSAYIITRLVVEGQINIWKDSKEIWGTYQRICYK